MALTQVVGGMLASSGLNASALTTGTLPKAQLPAGTVLQVVSRQDSSGYNLSAPGSGVPVGPTQFANYNIQITPTSATSKILIIVDLSSVGFANTSASGNMIWSILYRGTSTSLTSTYSYGLNNTYCNHALMYLDSPGTTSQVTYYIYGAGTGSTAGEYAWARTGGYAMFTAMEIAA